MTSEWAATRRMLSIVANASRRRKRPSRGTYSKKKRHKGSLRSRKIWPGRPRNWRLGLPLAVSQTTCSTWKDRMSLRLRSHPQSLGVALTRMPIVPRSCHSKTSRTIRACRCHSKKWTAVWPRWLSSTMKLPKQTSTRRTKASIRTSIHRRMHSTRCAVILKWSPKIVSLAMIHRSMSPTRARFWALMIHKRPSMPRLNYPKKRVNLRSQRRSLAFWGASGLWSASCNSRALLTKMKKMAD